MIWGRRLGPITLKYSILYFTFTFDRVFSVCLPFYKNEKLDFVNLMTSDSFLCQQRPNNPQLLTFLLEQITFTKVISRKALLTALVRNSRIIGIWLKLGVLKHKGEEKWRPSVCCPETISLVLNGDFNILTNKRK